MKAGQQRERQQERGQERADRRRSRCCRTIPGTLFTLLITIVSIAASSNPCVAGWILSHAGAVQPEDGSLSRPASLYYDHERDELCVTDEGTASIQIFNEHGLPLFHSASAVHLAMPRSTVVDGQGDFLLTDGVAGEPERRLRRLNWMGEDRPWPVESPRQAWRPEHLLRTEDGEWLTLDPVHMLLARHDAEGALRWTVDVGEVFAAGQGDVAEELVLGTPAVGPTGRIYIPVSSESCVLVLDARGRRELIFGTQGSRSGSFAFPAAVAFGPEGRILVLDRVRHRLLVFDPEHRFEAEFLSFGAGPGQIYYPSCLEATAEGRVFVGQGFQGRVQIYELFNTAWEPSGDSGNGVGSPAGTANPGD